ncbi:MAG: transposase, partial [candidate division KSB1 bacterium]|nr:transposase [candidate division KSB1 bacterium]
MTVCHDNLGFKFFTKKDIVANFNGGKISSDAGLLLFAEYDRQLGFSAALASHIEDTRDPRYTKHAVLDLIRQRIYQIAAGYEDGN